MILESRSITPASPEISANPAKEFLDQQIRPLLGKEITDFWISQADSWSQRFTKKTLAEFLACVGDIPSVKAKTDTEAKPAVNFKLEHWMVAANINISGNLAIALASEKLRGRVNLKTQHALLSTIGGAQARISWEKKHVRITQKLKSALETAPDETVKNTLTQALTDEQTRYQSPLNQLNYLQKNQARYLKRHTLQAKLDPAGFAAHVELKNRLSQKRFNRYSNSTNIILGRDDRGYFDLNFYQGPWSQFGLVEDPLRKNYEPKGISVSFYRYSPATGEKEFYTCWGKRDAFARTHQLTPAWQTSWSRIEKGNHPNQPYNPILSSLKESFSNVYAANGVEISYVDLNPNRNEASPIAVATINWESYSEKDQQLILDLMEQENKGLKHAWISETKLTQLRRTGLIDKDSKIGPAINGFLAIAIGSRSPSEILTDAINRQTYRELEKLIASHPDFTLEAIKQEADKLLEVSGNPEIGILLTSLLNLLVNQGKFHREVENVFPHEPHELLS